MEPFSSACRLCLWKGDKMIDVFRSNQKYNILDKIHKCIPIKFQKSDVTHVICHNCYYKLEIFAEFLTVCSRSDAILKRYVESQNISSNDESSEYPALKVVNILDSSDDGMTEDEEASVNKRRLEKSKTSANTAIKRDLSRLPETNDLSAAFKNAVSVGHLIEKPATTNEQPKQLQKPVKPKSAQVAPDQTVNKVQPTIQATEPAKQVLKLPQKVKRQASEVQSQDKQTVAQDKQTVAQDKQTVTQDKPPATQPTATVKHVATPEKHDPAPDKQVAPQKKPQVAQDKQIPVQNKPSTAVEKQVTPQKKQSAVLDKQVPAQSKPTSPPDKPVNVQDKQSSPQKKQAVAQDKELIVEKQTPVQTSADKQATPPNKQVPVKKQAVAQDKQVTVTEKPIPAQDKQVSPQKKQVAAQDKQVSPEKQAISPEKQVTQSKQISAHDSEVGKDKRESVAEKQQRSQWKEAHDKQVAEELKNLLEQEKAVAALLSAKPKVPSPTTRNSPRLYNEYTRHEAMLNGIVPCPDAPSPILTGSLRSGRRKFGFTSFQSRRPRGGPKTNSSFLNAVTDVENTGILSNVVPNGSDGFEKAADVLEVRDTGTFTVVVKNDGSVASNLTAEDVDTGSAASDVGRRSPACDDRWLNSLETLGGKVPLVRLNRVNVCLTCGSVYPSQDVLDRHIASSACTRKRKLQYSEKKFTKRKGGIQKKRTRSSWVSPVVDSLSPERPQVLTILESLGLVKKNEQDVDETIEDEHDQSTITF